MQQIFGDAANASNGSTLRTITTAYNAANQITSVSDPSSTINYTLDNLGRATTIAQSVNGLTPTVTLNQVFDAMNNRTELKATIASTLDFKNTYQYDKLQRLTDIVQQGQSGGNTVIAKHITQSFNALSQRTQIARYQSTGTTNAVATTDFTFDTANRLSGIAHKQGTTNLNTYAYTYDPLSRIATIVSTLEGTDAYSYDQTSQLVGATHTSQANETYGFDANGNRNTSGFTTGTNNQTTAGLGFTFVYDDEGNRTSKTETSTGKVEEYTWDHRNRLTKVVFRNTSGGAIVMQVDYEYDAYNRLVRRTFDADGAGAGAATNQYWVYDEGINAVLQFDGSSASNLSHRYLWSDNVDELLADEQIAGNNTLWGLADHLGSLRDIADYSESTGVTTIANHRTINSFGKLISETNTSVDLIYAYTGKQFDEATGLQHNLFRWLDPSLGQWLNEDPLSFAAGDENVRRYVGNKVVDSTDPAGLESSPVYNLGNVYLSDSFRAGVPREAYGEQQGDVLDWMADGARGVWVGATGFDLTRVTTPILAPMIESTVGRDFLLETSGEALVGFTVGTSAIIVATGWAGGLAGTAIGGCSYAGAMIGGAIASAAEYVSVLTLANLINPVANDPTVTGTIESAAWGASAGVLARGLGLTGCFTEGTLVSLSSVPLHSSHNPRRSLWRDFGQDNDPFESSPAGISPAVSTALKLPIECVPIGSKIATKNPRPWDVDASLPVPEESTWVLLALTVRRNDGATVDMELLRPRAWVESQGLRVGRAFALNIPELEVLGTGSVHSISDCPELAEGDGSFVTGRFATRRVEQTVTLQFADGCSVEGTAIHPVWSLDRQDWVPMGELQVGELLQSEHGPVAVASLTFHHRPCEVYNIEVHGEHVYQVGDLGVLVHNTCLDYARRVLYRRPNGVIIQMNGVHGSVGILPEYGPQGFPRHYFHLENGTLRDEAFRRGIPIDDWLLKYADLHELPLTEILDEIYFLPFR